MHSLNRKYNHGPTLSKLHKIYQKRIKKNYKYILKGKTNQFPQSIQSRRPKFSHFEQNVNNAIARN